MYGNAKEPGQLKTILRNKISGFDTVCFKISNSYIEQNSDTDGRKHTQDCISEAGDPELDTYPDF